MIFDQMDGHMNEPMMGWGSYMWLYMILGFVIFLIIVIVLVYILNRGQHLVEKQPSLQIQHNKNLKGKDKIEEYTQKENQFCPNCGEKLDNLTLKYCPMCGSKI